MRRALERRFSPFIEIARTTWQNKGALGYAWRILNDGVCDGCALGTSGMRDWTMPGIHLCWIRLNLLRLNTMPALDESVLNDVEPLERLSERELRSLGRIPFPMIRRSGERGFTRLDWSQAVEMIAARVRQADPRRLAFYLVSRGTVNETYYGVQKAVRCLGSNHIDNSARICHSPSTTGLKQAIGHAATTCSYSDMIGSDWVVFFGSNAANNQPVVMKYLHLAKKKGTKVAVVNPFREPGMEKYWVPSNVDSALLGTRIADDFFQIKPGGDIALINGVLKELLARDAVDQAFIDAHTQGWDALRSELERQSWSDLESASGVSRAEIARFAELYANASSAVFVWSMGITMHPHGVDNVKALANLALARGMVGRRNCGLMPIRGHSGVQGGAEMGAVPNVFPGGRAVGAQSARDLSQTWGVQVPEWRGDYVADMIDRAERDGLDMLYCVGSDLLRVLPDTNHVARVLQRVPLRVHHDIVLNRQMFVPGETVIVLPATTRYEMEGGNCETTTERRVIFNPEIPGRRISEARDEWRVLRDIACSAKPDLKTALGWHSTQEIRAEIAKVIPKYKGIENLRKKGDQFQWGGTRLCEQGDFATASGKAQFTAVSPVEREVPDGMLILSSRRGKQFNSMHFVDRDNLAGGMRDSLIVSEDDRQKFSLRNGQRVRVVSDHGQLEAVVQVGPIHSGMVMMYWPESNVLIGGGSREPQSGMPAYRDTLVRIERLP